MEDNMISAVFAHFLLSGDSSSTMEDRKKPAQVSLDFTHSSDRNKIQKEEVSLQDEKIKDRKRTAHFDGLPSFSENQLATHDDSQIKEEDRKKLPALVSFCEEEEYSGWEDVLEAHYAPEKGIGHLSKAWHFVERVQQVHKALGLSELFQPTATDDTVFFAERLLLVQNEFEVSGKRTHVDIGYHFTRPENVQKILDHGLLSKRERESHNIYSRYNGSSYGEGVYTTSSNLGLCGRFGDVGLMTARLAGVEGCYPAGKDFVTNDSIVKADIKVLRSSFQCLLLLRFDMSKMTEGRLIYLYHANLQTVIDEFFNGGNRTHVPFLQGTRRLRAVAAQREERHAQRQAAAARWLTSTPLSGSTCQSTITPSTLEMKQEKERFLLLVRVLLKYLERTDPLLLGKVKEVVKDCAERNMRKEPDYESVTASMRQRLRMIVSDTYWNRAEHYMNRFLEEKQRQADGSTASSQSMAITASGPSDTKVITLAQPFAPPAVVSSFDPCESGPLPVGTISNSIEQQQTNAVVQGTE